MKKLGRNIILFFTVCMICAICFDNFESVTAAGNMGGVDLNVKYGNGNYLEIAAEGDPDINGDGKVDIYDAGYLMSVMYGSGRIIANADNEAVQKNMFRCDLKQDAVIDINDLIWPQVESVAYTSFELTRQNRNKIGYSLVDSEVVGELHIPGKFRGNDGGWYQTVAIGDSVFARCSSLTGNVLIPDGVKTIGEYAFCACRGLTGSLSIPDSVTAIGIAAFCYCSGLAGDLVIPDGVTMVKMHTFEDCIGLTSVMIPDGVDIIDQYAFSNCRGLTSVKIPDSVRLIGYRAFQGCSGLTDLTIPNGVTTISSEAFQGCSGLTNVIIPDGVTKIGNCAFRRCSNLTSITIPKSVTIMGDNPFANCKAMVSINIDSENNSYVSVDNAIYTKDFTRFVGTPGNIYSNFAIPDGVKTIGGYAFAYCFDLTNIKIADTVTKIEDYAFAYCSGLANLVIPGSVIKIENHAFQDVPYIEYHGSATGGPWGAKSMN